jgi:hypothetical protein
MAERRRFICDAMLGGLARWLRAAGYSASFDVHIRDGELVRRALREGRCLLTSDSGVMERYAVTTSLVEVVFLPRGLSPVEQLGHVMAALRLPLGPSRCMACDGELAAVALAEVSQQVPRKVQQARDEFFRCLGCGRVYWEGTHWQSIRRRLREALRIGGIPDWAAGTS